MKDKSGCVYIGVNYTLNNLIRNRYPDLKIKKICKFGKTGGTGEDRVKDLNAPGVRGKYELIYEKRTSDRTVLENNIKKRLKYCQYENEEQYNEYPDIIIAIIKEENKKLIENKEIFDNLFL